MTAVVGCGYWGKNLVRNLRDLGALAMVCDPAEPGRALAAELAPQARIAGDYAEVLGSDVPAIVIATPAETHLASADRLSRRARTCSSRSLSL